MEDIIYTKDDLCLLISALAKYIETSSIQAKLDLDYIYMYVNESTYNSHINFLSHAYDLQNRLLDCLKNFE